MRGAAVLGGVVVAIAGFLLLQYSIEHEMITPRARVLLGTIVGLVALVAAVPLRKRGYDIVASSITGAGAVLLYAAAWAAHELYGMIGFPAAVAAMIAVTAACGWLAQRHGSQVIAVLGLAGGFATPLALAGGQDRPIPLFGYVLLLDLAFLFVGRRRKWPSIGVLALLGTFVIQLVWISRRLDAGGLMLALVMLAVFALAFALVTSRIVSSERQRWTFTQAGALFLPFVFAAWFAQDRQMSADLWPLAILCGVLAAGAGWVARRGDMPWLTFGTATGAVALAFTWVTARNFRLPRGREHELFLCGIGIALVHHVFAEIAARKSARAGSGAGAIPSEARTEEPAAAEPPADAHVGGSGMDHRASGARTQATLRVACSEVLSGARVGTLLVCLGFQVIALASPLGPHAGGPWPWLGLSMAMCAIVLRLVALGAQPLVAVASCVLAGTTALFWRADPVVDMVAPHPVAWCGALVSFGGFVLLCAWLLRERAGAVVAWSVAAFALPAILAADAFDAFHPGALEGVSLAAVLVLGTQIAFAATAVRSSALFLAAVAATWIGTDVCLPFEAGPASSETYLTLVAGTAVVLALWPVVRAESWTGRKNAWRGAALVPVLWLPFVRQLFVQRLPDAPIFLVPLALEALALFAALCLWFLRASEDGAQRVGRLWFACVAILFAAMILPVQVDHDERALTLALFAAGIALLHARTGERDLARVATAALVVATLELVLVRPWSAFPHSVVRVWNVLAYTYLLPAAAGFVTAVNVRRGAQRAVAAGIAGICAVVLVFAWINLEVANAWSVRPEFTWRYERLPQRDLTASIAWAVYALVLLGLGVAKGRGALRWASLVLLLLTIGKVFLFDLGHLGGLYRAASVFGLGLSLLLVSVLYQRFVFRRQPATI